MAAVSESGEIISQVERPFAEVSKGYTYFAEGDVLMAKITPCMENGKATFVQKLRHPAGFGSTEFHVLRPSSEIDGKYLFYMIWNPLFRKDAGRNMTGTAGQKRIPSSFLKDYKIPLPPLPEQKRIAAILDKADSIRRKRQEAVRLTEELLRSVFLDMFGDPVTNPKGWDIKKFEEVGSLDRGVSKHRPRNASQLLGGQYPLIQTGEVANSDGYIRSYKNTYSEVGLKQSKMWPASTLCITIAANIAKTGILTFDACFPDSVVGFTPNSHATTEYVQYWLSFLQKILEDTAPESAQKNINLEILRNLDIPLPPMQMQTEFSIRVKRLHEMKAKQSVGVDDIEKLFNSLLQRSFKGEL
ncbi:MAG: restriction endonuclease subunit S [Desulfuromonadaceae bacterium]|nr:restriction endonuclease subunit S [Desulfuromonadaceae bacterium]